MKDIVERLRDPRHSTALRREAADEIERLNSELNIDTALEIRREAYEQAAIVVERAQIFVCWGDKEINGPDVQKALAAAIRRLAEEE